MRYVVGLLLRGTTEAVGRLPRSNPLMFDVLTCLMHSLPVEIPRTHLWAIHCRQILKLSGVPCCWLPMPLHEAISGRKFELDVFTPKLFHQEGFGLAYLRHCTWRNTRVGLTLALWHQ
jgi:hypothetical protein